MQPADAHRTRSRLPSTTTTTTPIPTTTSTSLKPSLPNSTIHPRPSDPPSSSSSSSFFIRPPLTLKQVAFKPGVLHPDDEADPVLAITYTILDRVDNRAMSVKELGEAAYNQGLMRTSPSAAGQAIGNHIRHHLARHTADPENVLLCSYRLEGGLEDAPVSGALHGASQASSSRRGTTVWYLSRAAGKECPFQRVGYNIPQPGDNRSHLKRKIPPGDAASVTADQSRPNKFRIMLRLPPRTPIPPRPRPLPPPRYHPDDGDNSSNSDQDSSSSRSTDSSDEEEEDEDEDDDDEDMIDDFNTLLADGLPISIPCTRTGSPPRQSAFAPFIDSCEPPPDSEDEDDDFHNSMLRGDSVIDNDEDTIKQELPDFTAITAIKEEEIVAIVLHELATPEPTSISQPSQLAIKLEEALYSLPLMTVRPEQSEWTKLESEDGGVFSPMDALGADSPASIDIDDNATRLPSPALFSTSSYPSFSSIHSEHSHVVPPPSPWIKTEEEQPLFIDDRASPESIVDEFNIAASVQTPVSAIPIPSKTPLVDDSVSLADFESVSADDIDTLWSIDSKQCTTSTSAPAHPSSHRRGRPYAPRLSVGGLTAFNNLTGANRPGHARRHSHAVSTTSNRRLSIISSAFSDWTSGTPEDSNAPLATPSHTGWAFQWPIGNKDSSPPLSDVKIEEKPEEALSKTSEEVKPPKREMPLQAANTDDDLNRCLMAPSFNQCLINKTLPSNIRISTLLLLGIPVFQYRIEYPRMDFIRRMDTDFVNISTILQYAAYLRENKHLISSKGVHCALPVTPVIPAPPTPDQLPPNHIMITSGAPGISGAWVPLATARQVLKLHCDLPTQIKRLFLLDGLAEKFPEPIAYIRSMLISRRDKSEGGIVGFGKPFAKPSHLSAHELLVPANATRVGVPIGLAIHPHARGIPLALNMDSIGVPVPGTFALSPVAALSSPTAQTLFRAQTLPMPNITSLTSTLGPAKSWAGKSAAEAEPPLKPEEEEMLKAILKSPPRVKSKPKQHPKGKGSGSRSSKATTEDELSEEDEMNIDQEDPDQEEEEEVIREVVDISSDMEADSDEEEEERPSKISSRAQPQPQSTKKDSQREIIRSDSPPLTRRRSLRRMRSISSISSELTVSESESSAPPPSLDSRPAPKARTANQNQSNNAGSGSAATNGKGRILADRSTENEPIEGKAAKETKDSNAPRRSERTAKPIDRDRQSKGGKEAAASNTNANANANARAPLKTKRGGNVNVNINAAAASVPSEETRSIALRSSRRSLRTRA